MRERRNGKLGFKLGDPSRIALVLGALELAVQFLVACLVAVGGGEMEIALGVGGQAFGERAVKDFSSSR